jgi:Uma2 family endonuclease
MSLGEPKKVIGDALSEGWDYRTQEPLTLADGEPEPDGAVVRGTFQDYAARHPGPADVALVIEVADTTLARDRGIKLRSYARAGIPQYWIINLIDCQIETYSEPDLAALPQPTYRHRSVYDAHATVPLTIENQSVGTVSVASFFPPS